VLKEQQLYSCWHCWEGGSRPDGDLLIGGGMAAAATVQELQLLEVVALAPHLA